MSEPIDLDAARRIAKRTADWIAGKHLNALAAEVERLRAYAETTRYHQQQHAEAFREVVRLRAIGDAAEYRYGTGSCHLGECDHVEEDAPEDAPCPLVETRYATAEDVVERDILREQVERLRAYEAMHAEVTATLDVIKALHTDSPAGFCPSCGRLGDVSDTDDGLVPFPCPTLRAMGIEPGLYVDSAAVTPEAQAEADRLREAWEHDDHVFVVPDLSPVRPPYGTPEREVWDREHGEVTQ